MFCHFRSKIRVCGNHSHTLIVNDKDNRKGLVYAEKNGLQNCYLGLLKYVTFWKFGDFFHIIFIFAKIPKFLNFQKTGVYELEEPLKNVCTMFQVISFINVVFIAFWMWKIVTFQGIWKIQCNSICSFNSDFYATNDVLRSFFAF